MRIQVVGVSGSGKTTLARALAEKHGLPHVELDALYHREDWRPATAPEFEGALRTATAGPGWILDGNYATPMPQDVADQVEILVWLDLSRTIVLPALLWRTLRRGVLREVLWNGNQESLRNLLSLDPEQNLVLWSATKRNAYRQRFFARSLRGDVRVIRIRSHAERQQLMRDGLGSADIA